MLLYTSIGQYTPIMVVCSNNIVQSVINSAYLSFCSSKGDNPAFQPPLDVTVLEEEQCRIEQQGNEVQSFLSSKVYSEYKVSLDIISFF